MGQNIQPFLSPMHPYSTSQVHCLFYVTLDQFSNKISVMAPMIGSYLIWLERKLDLKLGTKKNKQENTMRRRERIKTSERKRVV